ncbi:hypothetical protein D3C87_1585090 [compost metagenome]
MRRLIDEITGGEHAAIDLFGNLRHITAVDKNNCFFLRDKRHARRTGKSGKPGQPLGRFRNILALVFVSARHEKTINTEIREASAKRRDTLATILGRGFIVERLKHGCHSNAAIPLNIHVKACRTKVCSGFARDTCGKTRGRRLKPPGGTRIALNEMPNIEASNRATMH